MQELREKTPFNCIVTGPTNCGKTEFLIKQLRGPFRHVFDYIVLVCPTYAHNAAYRGFANGDPGFLALSPDPQDLEEVLGHISVFFSGSNTLIILDDCAVSKDVAKRKSEFVSLAFSGRHKGLSVWVLTQQLTSIVKPFRDNVACVIAFHNPSQVGTKTLFEEYGGDTTARSEEKAGRRAKENPYSRLCFSLRDPFEMYLEVPSC